MSERKNGVISFDKMTGRYLNEDKKNQAGNTTDFNLRVDQQ